jgi:hypothetical protein
LWEPATGAVNMTLAIPRAQVAMASGLAEPDSTRFTLRASAGDANAGMVSRPVLGEAFHTHSWEITFRIGPGDTWSYEQTTMLNAQPPRGRLTPRVRVREADAYSRSGLIGAVISDGSLRQSTPGTSM